MRIRISYICIAFTAFITLRFWLTAQDSNSRFQALASSELQVDSANASSSELSKELKNLKASNREYAEFAKEMAKINSEITRIVISFLLLATVSYVFEERRLRKVKTA